MEFRFPEKKVDMLGDLGAVRYSEHSFVNLDRKPQNWLDPICTLSMSTIFELGDSIPYPESIQ